MFASVEENRRLTIGSHSEKKRVSKLFYLYCYSPTNRLKLGLNNCTPILQPTYERLPRLPERIPVQGAGKSGR